jgi:RHS repeat-associated protein
MLIGIAMPRLEGAQKREFIYNPDKHEKIIRHPESGEKRRIFNKNGTLAMQIDAKGQKTNFKYDDKKHLIEIERFNSDGQILQSQCVKFFYDENPFDSAFGQNTKDRLAAVQWGTIEALPGLFIEMYNYTKTGRIAAKRVRINRGRNNSIDFDLEYSYENGRTKSIRYPKGGPCFNYEFDDQGRPSQMLSSSEIIVKDVVYDQVTNKIISLKQLIPESKEYLEQNIQFNSKKQLSRIIASYEQNENSIVDIEYEYDNTQRVMKEKDNISKDLISYKYDGAGRLMSASGKGNSELNLEYEYDGFDNRLNRYSTDKEKDQQSIDHNILTNRIIAEGINYDGNGNIVKLHDLNLNYDVQNRLIEVASQDKGREQYAYNHANLRIWKRTTTGEEEFFIYGTGGRLLAKYRLFIDKEGKMDASLIDYEMYFAHKLLRSNSKPIVLDRLGSIRCWIDGDKNAIYNSYLPFGEEREITSNKFKKKYSTYVRDDFSGLDYAQQRYYSSKLGRFISPDPYERSMRPENPSTWNRYAYVDNDPINNIDPFGLQKFGIAIEPVKPSAVENGVLDLKEDTGHTFAYLRDANGNVTKLMSFGPSEPIGVFNMSEFKNGQLDGKSAFPIGGEIKTWEFSMSQSSYNQCVSKFDNLNGNPPNYTPDYQCTSAAVQLARDCGMTAQQIPDGKSTVHVDPIPIVLPNGYNKTVANPYGLQTQITTATGNSGTTKTKNDFTKQ